MKRQDIDWSGEKDAERDAGYASTYGMRPERLSCYLRVQGLQVSRGQKKNVMRSFDRKRVNEGLLHQFIDHNILLQSKMYLFISYQHLTIP